MKYSSLVGKIAADKDSKKIGKIIDLKKLARKNRSEKDSAKDRLEEHLIIHVRQFFKRDVVVPVDSEKILKVEGNFVWLNLSKAEFKELIKESPELSQISKGDMAEHAREKDKTKPTRGVFR